MSAILSKCVIAVLLLGWSALGVWMMVNYQRLFGHHPDDPAESSGARMLNVTQVFSVWSGGLGLFFYFLIS